jgi:3',5'-nucleoside bisphosphate phosphatase
MVTKPNSLLDLHTHTTASDGGLTPADLILRAGQKHLDVIAITDHDTTAGIKPAQQAAPESLVVIPGIELSAEDQGRDVHTLGYLMNIDDVNFQSRLSRFREDRYYRAQKIVNKLEALHLPLAWERIEALADGGSIGRPHIARAMIEAGYVASIQEAFDRYLDNGGPAYISRKRLSPEEAIEMIHEAGGVAVLAHPALIENYPAMVERLVLAGLDGVEVYHPDNSDEVRRNLFKLAEKYDLLVTGGTDFHGLETDDVTFADLGSVNPPPETLNALQQRAQLYSRIKPG